LKNTNTRAHSSTLYQVGSQGEVVVELEKEKEELQGRRTLAQRASDPAWPSLMVCPSSRACTRRRWTGVRSHIRRYTRTVHLWGFWHACKPFDGGTPCGGVGLVLGPTFDCSCPLCCLLECDGLTLCVVRWLCLRESDGFCQRVSEGRCSVMVKKV
jgi:hypothetical protein